MREILFRGKRIDNGQWVEGYYAGYSLICPGEPEDTYNATGNYCGQTPYVGFVEVDPATVGQYTGLKDKNGKRIFEGDIVKLWRSVGAKGDCRMAYRCPLVVEYCDLWAQFVVADNPIKEQYNLFDFQAIEVIGNIHDNGVEELNGD